MKLTNLILIALISIISCGMVVYGLLEIHSQAMIPHPSHPQLAEPDSYRSASISKGTAFLLLAVGIIGALSVRRRKKNKNGPAPQKRPHTTSEDRNEAFIKLNKQYLEMQYKIALHKSSGVTPPDVLQKEISDLERKVRLISRALE